MKNLISKILLGCVGLLLTCCSSSDDTGSLSNSRMFIGTWKSVKDVDVCSIGFEDVYNYSICEQKGRLEVASDGTFFAVSYFDYGSGCNVDESYEGTWEFVNGTLQINIQGSKIDITFFEVNNNILKIGMMEDENPGYTCDGDNAPSHYYSEYVKVN